MASLLLLFVMTFWMIARHEQHDHGSPLVHPDMSGRLIGIDRRILELAGVVNRLEQRVQSKDVHVIESFFDINGLAQTIQSDHDEIDRRINETNDAVIRIVAAFTDLEEDVEAWRRSLKEEDQRLERDRVIKSMEEEIGIKWKSPEELAKLKPGDFAEYPSHRELCGAALLVVAGVLLIAAGVCSMQPPKTPIDKLTERLDRLERGLRNLGGPPVEEGKRQNQRVRARMVPDNDD
jgi:hypothetical protein